MNGPPFCSYILFIKWKSEEVLTKFYQVPHYMNLIIYWGDGLISEIRAPLISTEYYAGEKRERSRRQKRVSVPVLARVAPPGELSLLQDVNDTILTGSSRSHDIREEDGKGHVTQQLCSNTTSHPTSTRNFLYCQQSAVNCTFWTFDLQRDYYLQRS